MKDVLEAVSDSSFRHVGIYGDEAGHSGGIGYTGGMLDSQAACWSVEGGMCWYWIFGYEGWGMTLGTINGPFLCLGAWCARVWHFLLIYDQFGERE